MEKSENFVVWFGGALEREIVAVLEKYLLCINADRYKIMQKDGTLRPIEAVDISAKIDDNLYLIKTPPYWSPGDLSGFLKSVTTLYIGKSYNPLSEPLVLPSNTNVIAFALDKEKYLPIQGVDDVFKHLLKNWDLKFRMYKED